MNPAVPLSLKSSVMRASHPTFFEQLLAMCLPRSYELPLACEEAWFSSGCTMDVSTNGCDHSLPHSEAEWDGILALPVAGARSELHGSIPGRKALARTGRSPSCDGRSRRPVHT